MRMGLECNVDITKCILALTCLVPPPSIRPNVSRSRPSPDSRSPEPKKSSAPARILNPPRTRVRWPVRIRDGTGALRNRLDFGVLTPLEVRPRRVRRFRQLRLPPPEAVRRAAWERYGGSRPPVALAHLAPEVRRVHPGPVPLTIPSPILHRCKVTCKPPIHP